MDGIHRGRHPGAGWVSLGHGVQVRADLAGDLVTRLRAWQMVLPAESSFTGLTAAQVRGWWTPPLPPGLPPFVAAGPNGVVTRPGLQVCRHDVVPAWELVNGVRVTGAAETLLACARDLGLLDVVVLGDAALHTGDATPDELWRVAGQRRRGSPRLRRAHPLMDGRAESVYEGLLRILHVACGIEVEPQFEVRDSEDTFVARADLRIVGTSRLPEYDGGDHLDRTRQRRDLRRTGRISDAGYDRRGYVKEDVLFRAVGILRDADLALGRPHDPRRIEAWHALLRDSLFTSSGRGRLLQRLGLPGGTAVKVPG